MSIVFVISALFLVEFTNWLKPGSYYLSLGDVPIGISGALPAIQIPHWAPWAYAMLLLASAAMTLSRNRFFNLPAMVLVLPLVYLTSRVVFVALTNIGDVFGGSGPNANPFFFIVLMFMSSCAVVSLATIMTVLWLFVRFVVMQNGSAQVYENAT